LPRSITFRPAKEMTRCCRHPHPLE
jgi:hypothetical protein